MIIINVLKKVPKIIFCYNLKAVFADVSIIFSFYLLSLNANVSWLYICRVY